MARYHNLPTGPGDLIGKLGWGAFSHGKVMVLRLLVGRLDARGWHILTRHYGLDGGEIWSLGRLGEFWGISREAVRQIEDKLFVRVNKLKKEGLPWQK